MNLIHMKNSHPLIDFPNDTLMIIFFIHLFFQQQQQLRKLTVTMWRRWQFLWILIFISIKIYCTQSSSQGTSAVNDTTIIEFNRICRLPKIIGSCKLKLLRYYFDTHTVSCQRFFYEGCGGNKNNFKTKASCESTCNGFYGN